MSRHRPMACWFLIVATCVCLTATRRAATQPLIDRVPADAVAYFGWAGTDTLTDVYKQSTLRHVVDLLDPDQLHSAWRRASPALRQALGDPDFAVHAQQLTTLWGVSARGKMAAYLTLSPSNDAPAVVLLWQPVTGDDREDLLQALKFYQAQAPHPAELVTDGPVVMLRINHPPATPALTPAPDLLAPAHLGDSPRFANTLAQLDTPGPLVAYLDLAALINATRNNLTNTAAVYEHDGTAHHVPAGHPLAQLIEPLALDTLGPVVATAGFDGRRWRTQLYLAAPAPRAGLASLLDAPALTADDLGRAPLDAPWTSAVAFDAGLLMDLLRHIATAKGPDAADAFEQHLASASAAVGVDVENKLIRGLGPAWSMYLDPDAAGDSLMGLTLVNKLIDPAGVERGLRSLQMWANLALLNELADQDFKIQVHTQTTAGHDLHTLSTPLLSPTWAIVNGQLVVGLTPQTVLAAADHQANPKSINLQDDFIALREAIGTRRLTALSWADLRRTAPRSYPNLLLLESLITGGASMGTGQPMPMILPPLGRLKPMLEPTHAIGWIDDAGWHFDSQSPFPGATLLSPATSSWNPALSVLPMLGFVTRSTTPDPIVIESPTP